MSETAVAGAGIGMSAAKAILGSISALWEGAAQGKMYEYQAGLAMDRARVAEIESRFATTSGATNAMIQGLRGGQEIGGMRAHYAAANVYGASPQEAIRSQLWGVQTGEAITRTNAAREAFGKDVLAATARAEAQVESTASATARTASYFNAASSILGGAADVSGKWIQASAAGVPGFGGQTTGGGGGYTDYGYSQTPWGQR